MQQDDASDAAHFKRFRIVCKIMPRFQLQNFMKNDEIAL